MGMKWYGDQVIKNMRSGIIESLTESINLVDRDINDGTPVLSGYLKGNNVSEIDEQNLIARERNITEYGLDVELGTRFQKAQPFFRIGFVKNVKNILNIFKKRGKNSIGN